MRNKEVEPAALDIAVQRLANQRLITAGFTSPHEAVSWFGAFQAQDYYGALWAVGLRTRDSFETDIEQALSERKIVRTWPMRRTLHFVAAEDVRWILKLTGPRMISGMAKRLHDHFDLDETVLSKCRTVVERVLEKSGQLSRPELYRHLENANIATGAQRGLHIVCNLAMEGLICFGSRQGKQQTLVLLDEWVPQVPELDRERSLAKLAQRYFTSHGPATVQDFTWWSGLSAADAKSGLEMVRAEFVHEEINGRTYWYAPSNSEAEPPTNTAYLLPAYDEFTVAYRDRTAAVDPSHITHPDYGYGIFNPTVVMGGKIVGTWKYTHIGAIHEIKISQFRALESSEQRQIKDAAGRLGRFLGVLLDKVTIL